MSLEMTLVMSVLRAFLIGGFRESCAKVEKYMTVAAVLVRRALVALQLVSSLQSLGSFDTFAAARLTPEDVRQVIVGVERSAFDTPESWTEELRARRVDLGSAEGLVLQGTNLLCGGTGNCQLFVFRKANGVWVSLFGDEPAPIVQGFEFAPATSHGIRDLTVMTHVSAEATRRETYKFDGQVYRKMLTPTETPGAGLITVRGVLSSTGKAGNLWILVLDAPLVVHDPAERNPDKNVALREVTFIGGRQGPQDRSFEGKHVELTGTLLRGFGAVRAGVRVQSMTVVDR